MHLFTSWEHQSDKESTLPEEKQLLLMAIRSLCIQGENNESKKSRLPCVMELLK